MMSNTEEKFFVRAFLRFLNKQAIERQFPADIQESLDVAIQCLETVYEISETGNENVATSSGSVSNEANNPLNHVDLFELFHGKYIDVSPTNKEESEKYKNEGNLLMKDGKFVEALTMYNKAIDSDATNPVFYCNRAAAYSRLGVYDKAVEDSKTSIRYDPNYSKAYGRLGLAYSKMNKHQEALDAYRNALRIEPDNVDYQNNMSVTQQRLEQQETSERTRTSGAQPNIPGVNLGNGFDLGAALNNPAIIQMATQMISEPAMQNLISQMRSTTDMNSLFDMAENMQGQTSQTPFADVFADIRVEMQEMDDSVPNRNEDNNSQPPPSQG